MRQEVLFVSHDLIAEGGGGLVAAWMLQALLSAYDVTLLTWDAPDYAAVETPVAKKEVAAKPRAAKKTAKKTPAKSSKLEATS